MFGKIKSEDGQIASVETCKGHGHPSIHVRPGQTLPVSRLPQLPTELTSKATAANQLVATKTTLPENANNAREKKRKNRGKKKGSSARVWLIGSRHGVDLSAQLLRRGPTFPVHAPPPLADLPGTRPLRRPAGAAHEPPRRGAVHPPHGEPAPDEGALCGGAGDGRRAPRGAPDRLGLLQARCRARHALEPRLRRRRRGRARRVDGREPRRAAPRLDRGIRAPVPPPHPLRHRRVQASAQGRGPGGSG